MENEAVRPVMVLALPTIHRAAKFMVSNLAGLAAYAIMDKMYDVAFIKLHKNKPPLRVVKP